MGLTIVTPPTGLVVPLEDARAHLRIESGDDDTFLDGAIRAVQDWLAGRNGWLGLSLGEQTLEFSTDDLSGWLWSREIRLPRPPLIAVESVKHVDGDGTQTTVSSGDYVTGVGVDGLAYVRMKAGGWPSTGAWDSTRICYRAGHVGGQIDAGLHQAILMTVARMYANRGEAEADFRQDGFVKELFAPYRVWGP